MKKTSNYSFQSSNKAQKINKSSIRKIALKSGCAVISVLFTVVLCAILCAPDMSLYDGSSREVTDSEGNILSYTLSPEGDFRFRITTSEVDPIYLKLLIAGEDKRFYLHPGIDPISIARAFLGNLKALRRISGASTLAMQCVRRLENNERNYFSKLKEAFGALYLTTVYGRDEVLSMYLTLAPFGGNTDGVKAASLRWFGHGPERLTPAEAALLVALPRAPQRIRPDRHPERAKAYRAEVLRLALENEVISRDVYEAALNAPLPSKMRSIERHEMPLGNYMLSRMVDRRIRLNVRPEIQKILKDAGAFYSSEFHDGSVMSAVVVDNRTSEIIGLLGSSDPAVSEIFMPTRYRSPGSALKPFVYALAVEKLKLRPMTILDDSPAVYGAYAPRNSDGKSMGPVSMQKALTLSLNRPAVDLLSRIGPSYFLSRVNQGRDRVKLPEGADPSLALALGGCSATLLDLSLMYSSLARDGMIAAPRLTKADRKTLSPFISKGAALSVKKMLMATPAPLGYAKPDGVFFKTGTSSGGSDALSIGGDGKFTVAIWCGRPDGRGIPSMTGMNRAAPVFLRIISSLNPELFLRISSYGESYDTPPALRDGRDATSPYPEISYPRNGDIIAPDSTGHVRVIFTCENAPCYLSVDEKPYEGDEFIPKHDGQTLITITDSKGHSRSVKAVVKTFADE